MIFTPPRQGKSRLTSELFPTWYLGRNPDRYIIAATYGQELADDFGRRVRDQMRDPIFRELFPACSLRDDSQAISRLQTTKNGAYFSVGVGSTITGRGAHLLLIDDPIKGQEEADSATLRRKQQEWFTSVAYTRLMPGGAIVIIMTRWHEDDLAGWLIKDHGHEGWDVVSLPAIAEDEDLVGRQPGEALWPECYPLESLEQIQKAVGSRVWTSLYQQHTVPAGGGLLKRDWFRFYDTLPTMDTVIQSWDATFKNTKDSDFVVGQVWGQSGANRYLLDQVRARMDFPETLRAIQALSSKWPQAHTKLIEDKANGPAIIATLRDHLPGIVPVNPVSSKEARLSGVSPYIESGNVYLPQLSEAPWIDTFLDEAASFPYARHDDQVDAMVHALTRLLKPINSIVTLRDIERSFGVYL